VFDKRHIPIVGVVGRSGSGKTTLLEKLIPELKRRGYRVGTIKHHAHPGFEIDQPGKDTWRHAQAGSDHVVIAAPDKIASIRKLTHDLSFEEIAATITDVDLILTEGYRRARIPKIEVVRAVHSRELLCAVDELLAVATDLDLALPVPCYGLDDVSGLVDVIERECSR
jgi:molybdopterin-guanine dinucleotide biosynthesis protein B